MQAIAKDESIEVVGVDIGGATTDVFSVFTEEYIFNRTVSANLGMSYSISNVWLPVACRTSCVGFHLILMKANCAT
jgi:hypothetical protein